MDAIKLTLFKVGLLLFLSRALHWKKKKKMLSMEEEDVETKETSPFFTVIVYYIWIIRGWIEMREAAEDDENVFENSIKF